MTCHQTFRPQPMHSIVLNQPTWQLFLYNLTAVKCVQHRLGPSAASVRHKICSIGVKSACGHCSRRIGIHSMPRLISEQSFCLLATQCRGIEYRLAPNRPAEDPTVISKEFAMTWLHLSVGALKVISGFAVVAGSVGTGHAIECLLSGSLTLAPVAWSVATHFVSDS